MIRSEMKIDVISLAKKSSINFWFQFFLDPPGAHTATPVNCINRTQLYSLSRKAIYRTKWCCNHANLWKSNELTSNCCRQSTSTKHILLLVTSSITLARKLRVSLKKKRNLSQEVIHEHLKWLQISMRAAMAHEKSDQSSFSWMIWKTKQQIKKPCHDACLFQGSKRFL